MYNARRQEGTAFCWQVTNLGEHINMTWSHINRLDPRYLNLSQGGEHDLLLGDHALHLDSNMTVFFFNFFFVFFFQFLFIFYFILFNLFTYFHEHQQPSRTTIFTHIYTLFILLIYLFTYFADLHIFTLLFSS